MGEELNKSHNEMIQEYLFNINNNKSNLYMLTIARDGEDPVRSILFYDNAIDASFAYNKYTDWGFAKKFLTVCLYEPSGKINTKILKRDQAGECTFIKQDYLEAQNIIESIKTKVDYEVYKEISLKFMRLFAKDNWRFDGDRFLKKLGIQEDYPEY
jgi:hypothetical protein